jgi:hypothetical protein
MNCCEFPSTSVAAGDRSAARDRAARALDTTVQAVLFSEIFKPLAKALGPLGDVAVNATVARLIGGRR